MQMKYTNSANLAILGLNVEINRVGGGNRGVGREIQGAKLGYAVQRSIFKRSRCSKVARGA